jgi:predicted GIY-YIG superfamily endonuclease
MLRCADGSLYTGITKDVSRRCQQHDAGTASRYTRSRLPVQLLYHKAQASRGSALRREAAIKAMTRREKLALIRLTSTNGTKHHERPGCLGPFRQNLAKQGVEVTDASFCLQTRGAVVTPKNAIAFVRSHGIVLEGARGSVPNLAEAVAGERIQGGWWGHAKGHDIFAATRAVRDSLDVLVCRLLDGKVTYIHRRLWPAVLRLADKLDKDLLAAIREEHTAGGSHRVVETPFPEWVPSEEREAANRAANRLTEEEALSQLGERLVRSLGLKSSRVKRRR